MTERKQEEEEEGKTIRVKFGSLPIDLLCMILTYTRISEHAAVGRTSRMMNGLTRMSASSPVLIDFSKREHRGFHGYDTSLWPASLLCLKPRRLDFGALLQTEHRFRLICTTKTFQLHVNHLSLMTTNIRSEEEWSRLSHLRSLTSLDISHATCVTLNIIGTHCPTLRHLTCDRLSPHSFDEVVTEPIYTFIPPSPLVSSSSPSSSSSLSLSLQQHTSTFPNLETFVCNGQPQEIATILESMSSLTSLSFTSPRSMVAEINALIGKMAHSCTLLTSLTFELPFGKTDLRPLSTLSTLSTLRLNRWTSRLVMLTMGASFHTLELVHEGNHRSILFNGWFMSMVDKLKTTPNFRRLQIENAGHYLALFIKKEKTRRAILPIKIILL